MAMLITDFGLVVLIWMVQLIIYPGFAYYKKEDLLVWHKKYTIYITIIVMPLMVGQLAFHGVDLLENYSLQKAAVGLMIVACWLITFAYAVPLHKRIDQDDEIELAVRSLIKVNWYRTILWSLVFVLQLFSF